MGAACAQTSCGQSFIKWKALREMNQKGIYSPDQISEQVDSAWASFNTDDSTTVDKETAQKIAEQCVNNLGSMGDGKTFDEEEFNSAYKMTDPLGLGKNLKGVLNILVTKMATKA